MNEVMNPFANSREVAETSGAKQSQSRELAETQTRYLLAQRMPRDERVAAGLAIQQFERKGLAERAEYSYKRGNEVITGPTIRTAEAIAQKWGNLDFGWRELSRGIGGDGVPFSEVEAFAICLQSRVRRALGFIVRHWRDTKQGGYVLKAERDIYELCANQAQRRVRSCILTLIPGDVVESCMQQADVTLKANVDMTPEGIAKMLAAFDKFKVTKKHIETLIQRNLDAIQPGHMVRLLKIYTSLKDGEAEPSEIFDMTATVADDLNAAAGAAGAPAAKTRTATKSKDAEPPPPPPPKKTFAELAEQIKKAADADVAEFVMEEAMDNDLPDDQIHDLRKLIETTFNGKK